MASLTVLSALTRPAAQAAVADGLPDCICLSLLLPGRPDCIVCTDTTYAHSAVAAVAADGLPDCICLSLLLPGRPDCIICTDTTYAHSAVAAFALTQASSIVPCPGPNDLDNITRLLGAY
jgi:hypothetical protein